MYHILLINTALNIHIWHIVINLNCYRKFHLDHRIGPMKKSGEGVEGEGGA